MYKLFFIKKYVLFDNSNKKYIINIKKICIFGRYEGNDTIDIYIYKTS